MDERKDQSEAQEAVPFATMKALAASWYEPELSAPEKERLAKLIRVAGTTE